MSVTITTQTQDINITVQSNDLILNIPATQGPAGPPGADGSAPELVATAGENMSSGRVVIYDSGQFFYFQPSNPSHAGRVIGITKTSALAGVSVAAQTGGIMSDAAFTFASESAIFVSDDGELTENPPASGLVQKIGVSISGTQILININLTLISN